MIMPLKLYIYSVKSIFLNLIINNFIVVLMKKSIFYIMGERATYCTIFTFHKLLIYNNI
jgi:hypothetical protein